MLVALKLKHLPKCSDAITTYPAVASCTQMLGSKFLFRGTFRERAKVREFLEGREFRGVPGNIEGK
eukprot:scaffold1350_cov56-Cyclotella_meneghiniana.AAC.29